MQQLPPAAIPSRLYLPQGFSIRSRVGSALIGVLCLVLASLVDFVLIPLRPRTALVVGFLVVQNLVELSLVLLAVDLVIRAAYLEGTVLVDRRIFGVRRRDLAWAPEVRLEQKTFSMRFSARAPDDGRWLRVRLRPEWSLPNPLAVMADAVLAGPPRPEPAGREAWLVAQQLRQLAANPMSRVS
jgi:hypothetical protein